MIVYHGSSEIVKRPDIMHSYRGLDFGKGFYVTSVQEQAERWAKRKSDLYGGRPIVNRYWMEDDIKGFKVKTFPEDMMEWIDFVCDCRDGGTDFQNYDVIIGKVANDKVFRVVDMYHSGIWDKQRALQEIKAYPNYDQIAFITQEAIDELLIFRDYMEVR